MYDRNSSPIQSIAEQLRFVFAKLLVFQLYVTPMVSIMSRLPFCLLLASFVSHAWCDVKLPAVISDHMVLQRDAEVPIWGWADQGEQITVSFAGQTLKAMPDANGRWEVRFKNLQAGDAETMTIRGNNEIEVSDVLVGEVWLGSGQSNMAMTVARAKNFELEKRTAETPKIRMFKESSGASKEPQHVGKGKWVLCSPDTVGSFSATLYFFGREVHRDLNLPVGLINSSVGGTPIESWIDEESQRSSRPLNPYFAAKARTESAIDKDKERANYVAAMEKYRAAVKKAKADGKRAPRKPRDPAEVRARKSNVGGLFNGKIVPLIPYSIRGALWYQGEANSFPEKAKYYQHQLPLLIQDWRSRWGYEFPFGWAQLPNYGGAGRDWPTVREGMLKTLSLPKTGMGINIDIGDTKDIHPKNKQDVGKRLAYWALGTVYERKVPAIMGPLPAGHSIDGSEVTCKFKHAAGLTAGDSVKGFEVSADGETWHNATARVAGETVVVSHPDVQNPTFVRYAWSNDPDCNLTNGAGLPASPFRLKLK